MAEETTLRWQLGALEEPAPVTLHLSSGEKFHVTFDPEKCETYADSFQVLTRREKFLHIRYDAVVLWYFATDDGALD